MGDLLTAGQGHGGAGGQPEAGQAGHARDALHAPTQCIIGEWNTALSHMPCLNRLLYLPLGLPDSSKLPPGGTADRWCICPARSADYERTAHGPAKPMHSWTGKPEINLAPRPLRQADLPQLWGWKAGAGVPKHHHRYAALGTMSHRHAEPAPTQTRNISGSFPTPPPPSPTMSAVSKAHAYSDAARSYKLSV